MIGGPATKAIASLAPPGHHLAGDLVNQAAREPEDWVIGMKGSHRDFIGQGDRDFEIDSCRYLKKSSSALLTLSWNFPSSSRIPVPTACQHRLFGRKSFIQMTR